MPKLPPSQPQPEPQPAPDAIQWPVVLRRVTVAGYFEPLRLHLPPGGTIDVEQLADGSWRLWSADAPGALLYEGEEIPPVPASEPAPTIGEA